MTDYNDGSWHAWSGGECPVHPKSEIHAIYQDGNSPMVFEGIAEIKHWTGGNPFIFRVTKEYNELPKPREFWLCRNKRQHDYEVVVEFNNPCMAWDEVIHVSEVLK